MLGLRQESVRVGSLEAGGGQGGDGISLANDGVGGGGTATHLRRPLQRAYVRDMAMGWPQ